MLVWYFEALGVINYTSFLRSLSMPTNVVVPALKSLKTWIYRHADAFHESWRFFIDLEVLAGYPAMADRSMTDDPHLWLTALNDNRYEKTYFAAMFHTTFFENINIKTKQFMSLTQYVKSRWLWATNGATTYSVLANDGKRVKTKTAAAISLTDEELLDAVYNPFSQSTKLAGMTYDPSIGVFMKPDERGFKRRLIANVPLGQ